MCLLLRFHPTAQFPVPYANCRRSMLKAIFRLTDSDKQKILRLREMGVRPPDIARRFGLSEGVVHKIVQTQRAMSQTSVAQAKLSPQREIAAPADLPKQAS